MSGAATVDNAVAIAIAVVHAVTPLVGNIAIARVVGGRVRTDIGRDVCLGRCDMGEASEGRSREGEVDARHGGRIEKTKR